MAILVFDNYIPGETDKSQKIMRVRCALAAKIWHSEIYQAPQKKPFIVSFAGVHQDGDIAGSGKIARLLVGFKIPKDKIITRRTTMTTTGDVRQLHSLVKELRLEGPLAIVTTNGHIKRTGQEVHNHFRIHNNFGPVHVISPSHHLNNFLSLPSHDVLDEKVIRRMGNILALANTNALSHGPAEAVAWAFSKVPPLRPFQHAVEERSHHGMRQVESSRYVAAHMKKAAKRLKTIRNYTKMKGQNPDLIKGLYVPKAKRQ